MRLAAVPLLAAASVTAAHADGFYYQQSYGISSARGDDAGVIGESLALRIALGWRWGTFQLGPTFAGHLAWYRDDALFDFVGGVPEQGDSDMEVVGIDGRYNARVFRNVSIYVRGGPRWANGTEGVLDGASGFGVGAATGVALTGKVRALGFVFVPMFFAKKGPLINATLFIDQNVEWYRLRGGPSSMDVSLPMVGTSIGFGAGSFF